MVRASSFKEAKRKKHWIPLSSTKKSAEDGSIGITSRSIPFLLLNLFFFFPAGDLKHMRKKGSERESIKTFTKLSQNQLVLFTRSNNARNPWKQEKRYIRMK